MFVELKAAFGISIQAVEIRIDQNAPPSLLSPVPPEDYIWLLSLGGGVFSFFGENN